MKDRVYVGAGADKKWIYVALDNFSLKKGNTRLVRGWGGVGMEERRVHTSEYDC
jgi:hypothetical protein